MALIVQKFGGTSVATLECIQRVAKKIVETKAEGHDVVVVVSAMSGETDHLISLAKKVQTLPNPREYAALLATGEQAAAALLSMTLLEQGCIARSYTGFQAHIHTNDHHEKARILTIEEQVLRDDLAAGHVPVVAGFQGVAANGDITTLGRGGSDTTAVAIAAALHADECQIYTDVEGIYTADPNLVPEAKLLDQVSFDEMFELASLGAKVVQQRAVEFAGKHQVPLRVLSSFVDGPGTLINFNEKRNDQPLVTGITCSRHEAYLTLHAIPSQTTLVADLFNELANRHIEIDMLVQHTSGVASTDFTFALAREEYAKAFALLNQLTGNLTESHVTGNTEVAKISLVGVGLRSHPAIISTLFTCLGNHSITTQLVSTSELRVSAMINEQHLEHGMRALHGAYGLDRITTMEKG